MASLSRLEIQKLEAAKLRPVLEYFFKGKKAEYLDDVLSALFLRFGTLHRILHAAPKELMAIPNVSAQLACFLIEVGSIVNFIDAENNKETILKDLPSIARFTRKYFNASPDRECMVAIALRANKSVIASEMLFQGTIDIVTTYPREIIRFAQKNNAKSILLVHNHPGGSCFPSREDYISTNDLLDILDRVKIVLEDHVVIGADGAYSILDSDRVSLDKLEIR